MALRTTSDDLRAPNAGEVAPRATPREDLVAAALFLWPLAGLYLDGWAHVNRGDLESFFTPWHAVFYSGFLVSSCWIVLVVRRRTAHAALREATPKGYGLGLVGLGMFAIGAVGDGIWHTVFGIEIGIDALLSPTHLILFVGGTLAALSPFRSAWGSDSERAGPAPLLSILGLTGGAAFFLLYLSLFNHDWSSFDAGSFVQRSPELSGVRDVAFLETTAEHILARGMAAVLVTSLIMVAPVLLLLRRWPIPPGTVTMLFGVVAAGVVAIENFDPWENVIAAVAAGAIADALIAALRPSPDRPAAYRTVAAAIPVGLIGLTFLAVDLRHGTGWSVEMWSGVIVLGGLMGYALSWLMVPARRG